MGDCFKIVAVMKNRGTSLSVAYSYVPHKWECEGVLYWPQSNLRSLRADASSEPDKNSWKSFNCKVKKDRIYGIEEAELWEEEFVNVGTDAENSVIMPKCSQKTTQLDKLFKQIDAEGVNETSAPIIIYSEPEHGQTDESCGNAKVATNDVLSPSLDEKLNQLLINQEKILANQQHLLEYIGSEFLEARATYDRIYKILKSSKNEGTSARIDSAEDGDEVTYGQRFKFPLSTVDEVLKLNREIATDLKFKDYLLKRFCTVGGTAGNEEGKNVARKMKAILFTEHVLTMFSWTGISRTAGLEKKEAFQACGGILSFFLELIKMADDRWSEVKNEKFFKLNTLKHAKQAEKAVHKKEDKKREVESLLPITELGGIETELDNTDTDRDG